MKHLAFIFLITLALNCVAQDSTHIKYYKNGNIELKGSYDEDGKPTGEWRYYFENGKLSSIENFYHGVYDGLCKYFHENGKVKGITYYTMGNKSGRWEYYHENGQLALKGSYKNGLLNGEWASFYDNGQVEMIKYYQKGKLMEIGETYDRNGLYLDMGTLKNGTGTLKIYKDGKLEKEIEYVDGEAIE